MTPSMILIAASCLGAMAIIPSTVRAADGRVTFSGAVVEPTCSVVTTALTTALTTFRPRRMVCANPGKLGAAARSYVVSSVRLTRATPYRVLQYFNAYVRASRPGAAAPVLLTQVYD